MEPGNVLQFNTIWRVTSKGDKYIETFLEYIKENFDIKIGGLMKKRGCLVNALTNERRFYPGQDNIYIVGEAAGLLSYLGDGISYALISGKVAANAIVKGLGVSGYWNGLLPYIEELQKGYVGKGIK